MMMIPTELLSLITRRHLMAEIRTGTAKQALGAVEALTRGGMNVFEISSNIPGASEILRHFAGSTEIMVGMGGVLDTRGVEEAAAAGATFVVSPIVAPELMRVSAEHHVTCILGALTPTEIIAAQRAGAELVKVFPVSAMGGSTYIRSLFRQFSHLSLMASGGINLENLPDYLALPVRAVSLGTALIPRSLVERGDWTSITTMTRRYVDYVLQWEAAGGRTPQHTASHPMVPDTMMAPTPMHPGRSNPSTPGYGAISQPRPSPNPMEIPAIQPNNPASFKPWDSKPVGPNDDDWIN